MMKRDTIKSILARPAAGGEVTVMGWARAVRAQKAVIFIQVNDGSCLANLQVVVPAAHPDFERLSRLSQGAGLKAVGELAASAGSGQAYELVARELVIYGEADPGSYPLQKKQHSFEFLRESVAHLRPRTRTFGAVLRVRNVLARAIHDFYQGRGFIWAHTPIITASDCEGAGQMFRVSTLDPAHPWTTTEPR